MVVGYNHNFRYKGELYHVQTEDSGVRNPHIVTLLYTGGTIIVSKKTSYAHLLASDNLEKQVEEIMKGQHREMLRRLRDGELDELIRRAARGEATGVPTPESKPAAMPPATVIEQRPAAPVAISQPAPAAPRPVVAAVQPAAPAPKPPVVEVSLDDLILSYLAGEDKP